MIKTWLRGLFIGLTKRASAPSLRTSNGAVQPQTAWDKLTFRAPVVYLRSFGRYAAYSPNQDLALRYFPCVVGRHSDCDHELFSPVVSRRHCAFFVRDGQVWVEDLGSRHGTRLNGQPVEEPRPLADGDQLDLGCLPFKVRLVEQIAPR
jgi:hypothetical protein